MQVSGDSVNEETIDAILTASRVLVAIAARSLADDLQDVTLAQYRALVVLAQRGPQHLSDLADELAVHPATATRMCDRLVTKNLIQRTPSNTDRRQIEITATDAALSLVKRVSLRRRKEIASIASSLPLSSIDALLVGLSAFSNAAAETQEKDWVTKWFL